MVYLLEAVCSKINDQAATEFSISWPSKMSNNGGFFPSQKGFGEILWIFEVVLGELRQLVWDDVLISLSVETDRKALGVRAHENLRNLGKTKLLLSFKNWGVVHFGFWKIPSHTNGLILWLQVNFITGDRRYSVVSCSAEPVSDPKFGVVPFWSVFLDFIIRSWCLSALFQAVQNVP